ncbi:hypothetical protein K4K59_005111 [Colletotrichum sp. SAR11_240]|nr:hypothetical protein K4K59_005111 [Colletotrichum sp. SAR11_240]
MAPKPKPQPKVNWNSVRAETEPWESLTLEQQERKLDEWEATAKQAFINPDIRRKNEADKKAKAEDTAHDKPEPSEEELNRKLVDYHSKMTQKIAQFVEERRHAKGPDRTKPRARVKNGLKSGRKPGKPLNGHEGPLLSEAEHELAMAARKAPDQGRKERCKREKRRARERKKLLFRWYKQQRLLSGPPSRDRNLRLQL